MLDVCKALKEKKLYRPKFHPSREKYEIVRRSTGAAIFTALSRKRRSSVMYSSSLFTIIIHTVQFIHHKVRTTHLRIIHTSTDDRGIAVARVGTIDLWERRGRGDCYKKGKVGVDLHIKITEGEMDIRNFDMFGSVMVLGQREHRGHHHEERTSAS